MNNTGIKDIKIILDNNQSIIAKPNMFDHLYISNINESGDEIAFIKNDQNLQANFFMIKLTNEIIEYNLTSNDLKENAFNILKELKNNIKEVKINFKNGKSQPFLFKENNNLYVQKNNNDLCLVLSEYNIKYKDYLFT